MLPALSAQLQQHLPRQRAFLLGLSGGVDSVVLLHLFAQLPTLKLRAVHIHHGLSPNADHWADFCRQLCEHYAISLSVQKVTISGTQGLEADARQARYEAVGQVILPDEVFVTAHHLDDQAETFLLALKRGSGVKGLSAMQALGTQQNFTVFRPLLNQPKKAIIAYAEQQHLSWINDESNRDNRFERNFLRNQILPPLNQRFPHFNRMVARAAAHCAEQQALLEELLNDELQQRAGAPQTLDIRGFEAFSALKQRQLLRLWLAANGVPMPSQKQLQAVISELIFAQADRQPEIALGEIRLRRYRHTLFMVAAHPEITPQSWEIAPETGEYHYPTLGSVHRTETTLIGNIGEKSHRLLLPEALRNEPLSLKIGVSGKVAQYAKPHRETMKKIWQQHAVPPWERAHTALIFWQEQLVAVWY